MKKSILALSLLAAVVSTQAMAQDGTMYISANVGQSDYKVDSGTFPPGVNVDKKDTSFGIAFGYNFTKIVALEAGYFNMGKFKVNGTFFGFPITGDGKAQGVQVSAVVSAPVADAFTIYGRLGGAYTDRKATACSGTFCSSNSDKKAELLYGIGAGYAFAKNVTGTIEYQKLNDTDVSSINLGIRFGF
jgi:OmpA-OmpF porin, OOP family